MPITKSRYIADFIISSNNIADGAVTASDLGTVYTSNITENTNLYFTNERSQKTAYTVNLLFGG
jgi:hypothetical protein